MSSRPSQTRKPWADMTASEKNEAALPLLRSGKSFGAVAALIGAPSRNAIATVAGRLVKANKLPSATSRHGRAPSQPATSSQRAGEAEAKAPPPAKAEAKAGTGTAAPSVPAPTWTQMSPDEKREAVKARILDGHSMGAIAAALGAPNRGSIGSVADRLRTLGELPRRDLAETGREGRLVQRMNSPAMRRGKSEASLDRHIARRINARIETPKVDPGLPITITKAAAFDPLPGVEPVALVDIPRHGRCRWPVEPDAPGHFMCGAPCEATAKYCCAHKQLSISPYQPQTRKAA